MCLLMHAFSGCKDLLLILLLLAEILLNDVKKNLCAGTSDGIWLLWRFNVNYPLFDSNTVVSLVLNLSPNSLFVNRNRYSLCFEFEVLTVHMFLGKISKITVLSTYDFQISLFHFWCLFYLVF
jgi:hypothetical protein